MNKVWLKTYEKFGLEYNVQNMPNNDISLLDVLEKSFRTYPNRPAFHFMDKSMSFAQFNAFSLQIASYLQSIGLQKNDRVAIMLPNIFQYPVIAAAVIRAGFILVNVNPLYTSRELEHQLKDSGSKVLFILENFASTYQKIDEKTVDEVIICRVGDMLGSVKGGLVDFVLKYVKKQIPAWSIPGHKQFKKVLKQGGKLKYTRPEMKMTDTLLLQYTGGTTGVSKGAELTHKNLIANVFQSKTYMGDLLNSEPNQNILCALPLYHIFAFNVCFINGIEHGMANVLIPNPRDLPSLIEAFDKYTPTFFPAVNTLFNALLHNDEFKALNFSKLRLVIGGGMAVQKSVSDTWKAVTAVNITQGYGLSETSPMVTAPPPNAEFDGSVGVPLPDTEVMIIDSDGNALPINQEGEICIRGPQVMKGYWNRPEATAKSMTKEGFFRTGDIGVMNENGCITIVDRLKDMILVSGFNVYPTELEEVLATHPKILEAGVIGIPNDKSGEVPKAYIVKSDPSLTVDEVKSFCRDNLTGYKQPRAFEFVDELPKSNVGKILRKDLRQLEAA